MAISDKTRKTLWARSGNRCAICRIELIKKTSPLTSNHNIGEECHLVSKRPTGPRADSSYASDYDDYENLILLCANDHKKIDEHWQHFPVHRLQVLKSTHEEWVSATLEGSLRSQQGNNLFLLNRINTGKELMDLVSSVDASRTDHCELKNQKEVELVSALLENIVDWIDLFGMDAISVSQRLEIGLKLNYELKALESNGLVLFGVRSKTVMRTSPKDDGIPMSIGTFVITRSTNPLIMEEVRLPVIIEK